MSQAPLPKQRFGDHYAAWMHAKRRADGKEPLHGHMEWLGTHGRLRCPWVRRRANARCLDAPNQPRRFLVPLQ
jgi:hypothetical protein